MQRENRRLTLINSLIVTASRNLRVRLDALNRLRNRPPTLDAFSELRDLLKDSVEGIAMDIKFQPGETVSWCFVLLALASQDDTWTEVGVLTWTAPRREELLDAAKHSTSRTFQRTLLARGQ